MERNRVVEDMVCLEKTVDEGAGVVGVGVEGSIVLGLGMEGEIES